jgi:hypothetical protein
VLSELGQAHSTDSQGHDEDIGDDDQVSIVAVGAYLI